MFKDFLPPPVDGFVMPRGHYERLVVCPRLVIRLRALVMSITRDYIVARPSYLQYLVRLQ